MNYTEIATTMLGIDEADLPERLLKRLDRINDLIEKCPYDHEYGEGRLRSRQVVAMVIAAWENEGVCPGAEGEER